MIFFFFNFLIFTPEDMITVLISSPNSSFLSILIDQPIQSCTSQKVPDKKSPAHSGQGPAGWDFPSRSHHSYFHPLQFLSCQEMQSKVKEGEVYRHLKHFIDNQMTIKSTFLIYPTQEITPVCLNQNLVDQETVAFYNGSY